MSRHHAPHNFKAGDQVTIYSGFSGRTKYPGVVDRVTPTQVHVTYDASSTKGRPAIKAVFYGATGAKVGGNYMGAPMLSKKDDKA